MPKVFHSYFELVKKFVEKYERPLSSGSLILGFIIDSLTLRRIDFFFETFVLFSYIITAGIAIALFNLYEGGYLNHTLFGKLHAFLPIIIQFVFGGLFSGLFIFYFRSASISVSWPFILCLLILFIGNEVFKKYYKRMVFTLSVYFFSLFTFSILYLPIFVKRIGDSIFILSGLISIIIMMGFVLILFHFIPKRIIQISRMLVISIISIYILVHVFYFTNLIPPIPLSLKEIGVYHKVTRTPTGFNVESRAKPQSLFARIVHAQQIVPLKPGETLSAYSAVFAPTALQTNIVHHWQYYDETLEKWVSKSRVSFPITGGRGEGYRGYSLKSALVPGQWQVRVETKNGQVIGSMKFTIETE